MNYFISTSSTVPLPPPFLLRNLYKTVLVDYCRCYRQHNAFLQKLVYFPIINLNVSETSFRLSVSWFVGRLVVGRSVVGPYFIKREGNYSSIAFSGTSFLSFSPSLSFYLSIYLYIHLSIYLSIYLYITLM